MKIFTLKNLVTVLMSLTLALSVSTAVYAHGRGGDHGWWSHSSSNFSHWFHGFEKGEHKGHREHHGKGHQRGLSKDNNPWYCYNSDPAPADPPPPPPPADPPPPPPPTDPAGGTTGGSTPPASTSVNFTVNDNAGLNLGSFQVTYDSSWTVGAVLDDLLLSQGGQSTYAFESYDVTSATCGSLLVDTDTLDAAGVVANPNVCLVPASGGGTAPGAMPGM